LFWTVVARYEMEWAQLHQQGSKTDPSAFWENEEIKWAGHGPYICKNGLPARTIDALKWLKQNTLLGQRYLSE
jgi:hypothetical protein